MEFGEECFHDGPNVTQDSLSLIGSSWRPMGAIAHLVERKLFETPSIVIMIPSTGGELTKTILGIW